MSKPRWAVALEGERFDLEDARDAFGNGTSIKVADLQMPNRKITALLADELDGHDDAAAVNEAAERLIVLINGYLFARDADRRPLRAGAIYGRDADGRWATRAIFMSAGATFGRLRARGYVVAVHADGTTTPSEPQLPPEVGWLSTTMDETALDILHMLRGEPEWFDLYMAFERMRDDLNRRLPKAATSAAIGWPNTNHFSQSAQVHRHSRVKWPPRYDLRTAMPLREARVFVAQLVRSWLQWRASQKEASERP